MLGGGSVKGGVVGVAGGEDNRRLIDWAREDKGDEMKIGQWRFIEAGC